MDIEAGVNYLAHDTGITPLLNHEGDVVLTKDNNDGLK